VIPTNISLAPKFKAGVANTGKAIVVIAVIGLAGNQLSLNKRVATVEHQPTEKTASVSVTAEPSATPSAVVTPTVFIPTKAVLRTIVPTLKATISR
jgi:hypothetical protein